MLRKKNTSYITNQTPHTDVEVGGAVVQNQFGKTCCLWGCVHYWDYKKLDVRILITFVNVKLSTLFFNSV
jgi:hypothetical protein